MRSELDKLEQIDRYLNRQMEEEELAGFEREMQADPAFRGEVNDQKLLHEMVMDQGLIGLRKKLQAIDSAHHSGSVNFKRWGTGIALVLIISSLVFYRLTTDINKSGLSIPAVKDKAVEPIVEKEIPEKKNESPEPPPEKSPDTFLSAIPGDTAIYPVPAVAEQREKIRMEMPLNRSDTLKRIKIAEQPASVSHPEKEIIDCNLKASILMLTAVESCNNSPTGKIVIDKNSDLQGSSPFAFSIDTKNYTDEFVFSGLYPGSYNLTIRDAAGCVWVYDNEIRIDEKDCRDQEYSFYPAKGEVWKIPVTQNSNGRIEVYSRGGSRVYSASINNGHPDTWDGTSNGQPLPMGSYTFILKLGDEVLTGSVTILR
jgi:hypothetical protein